ncbi:MAG: protein kinase [Myxococcota bacterium]
MHGDRTGEVLLDGKLQVLRRLGKGGMGTVYEVEHLLTKHRRALKLLHPGTMANETSVARFQREVAVAGTLDTPYVVETYDAGQLADGTFYVLMELLEGLPINRLIKSRKWLSVGEAAAIGVEICRGLAVAHAAGIVHRDLKPDNVFLVAGDPHPSVRLLDFGVAKFTRQVSVTTRDDAVLGTPYYLAPEQLWTPREITGAVDIYALGVMMYELVSGRVPYREDTLPALVMKIVQGEYPPLAELCPGIAEDFEALVVRAMRQEAGDRFASVEELRRALEPFATTLPSVSREAVEERPRELAPLAPDGPAAKRKKSDIGVARVGASAESPGAPGSDANPGLPLLSDDAALHPAGMSGSSAQRHPPILDRPSRNAGPEFSLPIDSLAAAHGASVILPERSLARPMWLAAVVLLAVAIGVAVAALYDEPVDGTAPQPTVTDPTPAVLPSEAADPAEELVEGLDIPSDSPEPTAPAEEPTEPPTMRPQKAVPWERANLEGDPY